MAQIDPRLKKQLDAAQLKYHFDGGHVVEGMIAYEGGRSQLFIIWNETDELGPYEDRDIGSVVADVNTLPIEKLAAALLRLNGTHKIGYLAIVDDRLVMKADIPVDASPEAFRAALEIICRMADDLEHKLTSGKDEF